MDSRRGDVVKEGDFFLSKWLVDGVRLGVNRSEWVSWAMEDSLKEDPGVICGVDPALGCKINC